MRFYVQDSKMRAAARAEFALDCERIRQGLSPKRVLETDIYITKRCNLHCSYCYFRDYFGRPDRPLPEDPSLDQLKTLLDQIEGRTYCLVILGGEPFSRPDFTEILTYARSKDIYSIRISTNGLYVKRKKDALSLIDRLNVSFDCTRSREYPDRMKQLLMDIVEVKEELGEAFPRLCLAWTTGSNDDFETDVRPLLDYAIQHRFEVKFLPVKIDQRVDWSRHRDIVLRAIEYASPKLITNELCHTDNLSPEFVFNNCLQNIQYYIDFEGQFLYPCDEFPGQRVGSIYDRSLDKLFEYGLEKFGTYPRKDAVCSQCPSACHSDNSYIFKFPERQLQDLA
jgi:MoaA/NifB/PqqE/SkfB family radical SAM enzyme